jgi:drug/metabolite transporter (DMT)-like permease
MIATLGGMMAPADAARRGQLLVAAAAVLWSSAGPVTRAVDANSATQVSVRAGVGAAVLLVYLVVRSGRGTLRAFLGMGRAGLVVAVALAIVNTVFLFALAHTTVAHVMLFQASAPFVAAMLAWAFLHERIPPRTWVAMSAALAGVAIMVGGSLGTSGGLIGDALCVVMASGFALVIVVTRRHREVSMTPATTLGMAMAFVAMAPFSTLAGVSGGDIALLSGLGAFQIAAGLILFTAGARLIPAAQAGLITLIEVVLGPLWVWLIYSERPDTATMVGGSVIVAAVLLHAYLELRPRFATGRAQVEP